MPAGLVSRQNLLRAPSLESWRRASWIVTTNTTTIRFDNYFIIVRLTGFQYTHNHPKPTKPRLSKAQLSSAHSWNFPLPTTSIYWKGNHPCRSRVRFSLPSAFSENRNRRVVCSGSGTSIGRTKLINCHQQRWFNSNNPPLIITMRKAVQAATRRIKNTTSNNNNNNYAKPEDPPSGQQQQAQQPQGPTRGSSNHHHHNGPPTIATLDQKVRKATPEEAVLTAKNYRLAKELVSMNHTRWTKYYHLQIPSLIVSFIHSFHLIRASFVWGIAKKAKMWIDWLWKIWIWPVAVEKPLVKHLD